jgi:hypothetical protein
MHYELAADDTEEADRSIFMLFSENQLLAKQLPTKRTPYVGFGVSPLQLHKHQCREDDDVADLGTRSPAGERARTARTGSPIHTSGTIFEVISLPDSLLGVNFRKNLG